MTALTIRGLTKGYHGHAVLCGIDLDVPGGLTSVLGPSGCGKTTLLRLVAGFLEPDSGTIEFDGRIVAGPGRSLPPRDRRVGYVPQEGALFPHLDVAANVTFGLARSERRTSTKLQEMLDLVELPSAVSTRYPHELSGGQQQRVALARALAPGPAVVLLDEPFSSLDSALREGTGQAVARALRATGTTGLLVTHDQGEALSLSDQVAVMRDGRLVQVAAPVDLYQSPADSDVAGFVGGSVLLSGQVSGVSAQSALGQVTVRSGAVQGLATLAVKPEQIVVNGDRDNGTAAEVVTVSFFGHDATVRLRLLADGPVVVARISSGKVPSTGDVVGLTVAGDVIAFRTEGPE
ncbi:MAG: ATP-binding cassette domain-containing protein [Propionibacteriales bacterium]|nr:ATP-binding cassette domain-containing protein [Propionibacteriales bacterium]